MIVVLRWHPPKRCSLHMQPRQVVVLTPPKSSYQRTFLSRQQSAPISPLAAILLKSPTSVANKRLTRLLSPLAATLTKNRGRGVLWLTRSLLASTFRHVDVQTFQRFNVPAFSRIPDGSGLAVADSRLLAFHQSPTCPDPVGVTNHQSLSLQSNAGTEFRSLRRRRK